MRRGSRRRASFAEEAGWWQRLQITEDQQERLVFHLLTDRARTQAYLQSTQRLLVDQFIKGAIGTTATDYGISVTLFEMLIPNELKDRAPEQRDIVLVVNEAAAHYPWELMQERRPGQSSDSATTEKPLSVQAGMLRQLQSIEFRERVVMAQGRSAKEVATEILTRLHERDYRIVHLAGHGVYDYPGEIDKTSARRDPQSSPRRISGMVIGTDEFLTPAEIGQMRAVPDLVFINCCHLGRIEDQGVRPDANFPRLAANLATELIRMGVRAVVASGWAVDDQAAQTFADVFTRGAPINVMAIRPLLSRSKAAPKISTIMSFILPRLAKSSWNWKTSPRTPLPPLRAKRFVCWSESKPSLTNRQAIGSQEGTSKLPQAGRLVSSACWTMPLSIMKWQCTPRLARFRSKPPNNLAT